MSPVLVPALLLDAPGAPQTLRLGQLECSDPAAGQVRIMVEACAVNPVDQALCGTGAPGWRWPHVLGLDVAGTVDSVGDGVPASLVGVRVAVHHDLRSQGGFAGALCVDANMIAEVPDGLSAAQAATTPCPGLTAVQAVSRAGAGSGSRVLVTGAGGAVGTFVCQLAIAAGADVDAVSAGADVDRLLDFGVTRVADYRHDDTASKLRAWAGPGYDIITDLVSRGTDTAALLGYGATIVSTVGRPDLSKVQPFTLSPTAIEIALGAVYPFGTNAQRKTLGQQLGHLLAELAAGTLTSPPFTQVPLADLPQAWQGKIDGSGAPKLVAIL